MENIEIRLLSVADWKDYKEIRLEALESDPEAFGQTYRAALKQSDDLWKLRLAGVNLWVYAAFLGGEMVGITSGRREHGEKFAHVGIINSVFVQREYRGKGVAAKLLVKTLDRLKQEGLMKAKLTVVATQREAIQLYEAAGFEQVGLLKKEVRQGEKYKDEMIMEKFL